MGDLNQKALNPNNLRAGHPDAISPKTLVPGPVIATTSLRTWAVLKITGPLLMIL